MDKIVRFYRTRIIKKDGSVTDAPEKFWASSRAAIEKLDVSTRRRTIGGSPWYGDAGKGDTVSLPYIRCGRERLRGDWPSVLNDKGVVEPLQIADGNLFEAAYLVPFGTGQKVAIVGPIRGLVAKSSVEAWVGAVLGFVQNGHSLELEPLIDPRLAQKLADSIGVSRLEIKLPADQTFNAPAGERSAVETAIESSDSLGADLDRAFTFSYGNRKKGGRVRELLAAARRLMQAEGVSKIEATLMLPHEDGFRTEVHELLQDRVAVRATFNVKDDQQPDTDVMLAGVQEAITEYQRPEPTTPAHRV